MTAKKWTITATAADSDTTNFEGGGFGDVETNTISADITMEFDYDGNSNPFDPPLALLPGTNLVNVSLYLNTIAAGVRWFFPLIKILTTPNNADPKSMLGGAFTFRTKGAFTFPTGSF